MEEKHISPTEFHDWELLHDYDDHTFPQRHPDSNSTFFQGHDSASGTRRSTICLDYFSLPNHQPTTNESLIHSQNLNSIDFDSENNRICRNNTSELGSESGDDLLDQSHASDLPDITKSEEISTDNGKFIGSSLVARDEPLSAKGMCNPTESEESSEESESQDEILDDSYSNWSGNESVAMKSGDDGKESEAGSDRVDDILNNEDSSEITKEEMKVEAKSGELEAQRRRAVWWKVPFQVLRYCFLRAGPAWSFSVAAAFMGMVILGRRLYKMKRKAKSLPLKIAVVDKKVSQFADQAARLNEAFSMVRRVPVVRASLTGAGAGANSWPAMTLR